MSKQDRKLKIYGLADKPREELTRYTEGFIISLVAGSKKDSTAESGFSDDYTKPMKCLITGYGKTIPIGPLEIYHIMELVKENQADFDASLEMVRVQLESKTEANARLLKSLKGEK